MSQEKDQYKNNEGNLVRILHNVGGLEYFFRGIKKYEKSAVKYYKKFDEMRNQHLFQERPDVLIRGLKAKYRNSDDSDARVTKEFQEIKESIKHCKKGSWILPKSNHGLADYAVTAYIDTLGRLIASCTSSWAIKRLSKEIIAAKIPTILKMGPIRNKFTAHHQGDSPRTDDHHAGMHEFGPKQILAGQLGNPEGSRIQYQFFMKQWPPLPERSHQKGVAHVKHLEKDLNFVCFTPTIDHLIILNEVVDFLEAFLEYRD